MEPNPQDIPFSVADNFRDIKKGIVAKSLDDLMARVRTKFGIPENVHMKIVLDHDGTEVDDDAYFYTLERNTSLMVLTDNQKWWSQARISRWNPLDEIDGSGQEKDLKCLVRRLQDDWAHITMLGGKDLELLSDMDPDSLADFIPDKKFLEDLKEASGRFLSEKREAQEAMDLLKLYHKNSQNNKNKAQV